jgi:hypothetical protein
MKRPRRSADRNGAAGLRAKRYSVKSLDTIAMLPVR